MKITLFLMTQKGYDVLKSLINNGYIDIIDKVVSSKDSNVENDYYSDIKLLSNKHKIPFFDRKDSYSVTSSYCFAISWRWLIEQSENTVLIVFHDSLLPKYRGFAPLVNMLINKEPRIGVSAIFADREFDTGDIIAQKSIGISYPIKIHKAIDVLTPLYAELMCEICSKLKKGEKPQAIKQDESKATYSLWRDEEDYRINWSMDSESIKRHIDSVGYPYKMASVIIDGELFRIGDAEVVPDVFIENRSVGKVLFMKNGCPVIVCGEGLLKITEMTDEKGNSVLPLKKFRLRFQ